MFLAHLTPADLGLVVSLLLVAGLLGAGGARLLERARVSRDRRP
jgi:hypothetical protein